MPFPNAISMFTVPWGVLTLQTTADITAQWFRFFFTAIRCLNQSLLLYPLHRVAAAYLTLNSNPFVYSTWSSYFIIALTFCFVLLQILLQYLHHSVVFHLLLYILWYLSLHVYRLHYELHVNKGIHCTMTYVAVNYSESEFFNLQRCT